MCKSNNMVSFDGYNLIFSPLFDKQEVIDLSKYPNKTLYPAEDLFPSEPIKLYEELDHISSLDVFGVSPYGDDRLIQKISEIPNLQIYVYNMNPEEVYSWNNKLKRECCIDSSLFVV